MEIWVRSFISVFCLTTVTTMSRNVMLKQIKQTSNYSKGERDFPQYLNTHPLKSLISPPPEAPSLLRCGLVYSHLLLWELSEQRGVETALKTLCEPQVWLEPNLVGPQQRRSTSWSAKVTHGFQQLFEAVVMIDHISCEHVVVVVGWVGKVSFQVLTPDEGSHLRGVAGPALGVPQKVKGQIRQDVCQVSSCHPSTWKKSSQRQGSNTDRKTT